MKKFYATVLQLSSTTELGRRICACVYAKYNCTLLSEDQLPEIFTSLNEWSAAILGKHPRFKPLHIHSHGFMPYSCGYGRLSGRNETPQIWMSASVRNPDDRRPFVLYLSPVEIDYTQEGGAR